MGALTKGGLVFYFDEISKFYNSVLIRGWLHKEGDALWRRILSAQFVADESDEIWAVHSELNLRAAHLMEGANTFLVQGLRTSGKSQFPSRLRFNVELHGSVDVNLEEAVVQSRYGSGITRQFFSMLKDGDRVVDLGGRARSGRLPYMNDPLLRDKKGLSIITFDIVAQDGVDIVGDAHEMSSYVEKESIDAIMSVSVFEHLLMPWKVALEMNAVLKMGGYALIHTHQTIGMHDIPWDYWRYSSDSWKAIFNASTGFEIITTDMHHPMHIVSFMHEDRYRHAESSVGFESSAVLVKKNGRPTVSWNVPMNILVADQYPRHKDDNFSD